MTVRAVAGRAGVHERTVHRHFPNERDLRAAVLQRLVEESGVTVEGMRLDDLPGHVEQLFCYLGSFSSPPAQRPDAAMVDLDERRTAALLTTVREGTDNLSESDQQVLAALLDVPWGLPTYRRLTDGWGLDATQAARSVAWLLSLITDAVGQGRLPGSADRDR